MSDRTHERLIRLPEVIRLTGKSRTSIYLGMGRGEFPLAVAIGERSRAWIESEVVAWIHDRIGTARQRMNSAPGPSLGR